MTTRTTALPIALTAAALLSACTTMSAPSPNLSTGVPFYIMDTKVREVRREAMSRYVCADGRPITCKCTSRVAWTCDCACQPFGPPWGPF